MPELKSTTVFLPVQDLGTSLGTAVLFPSDPAVSGPAVLSVELRPSGPKHRIVEA
jgi:hypothetical protein